MGENAKTRRRADTVAERKLCQEKKERVGGGTSEGNPKKELQTEGRVQRKDPGDGGSETQKRERWIHY